MTKRNLLVIDDNRGILKALELLLTPHFNIVKTISQPDLLHTEMRKISYDVVLLDMNFNANINSGNEGFYWLDIIKKSYPMVSVVMFTAYGDVELAVRAVREGAIDFILKPWDNAKLIITLKNAAETTHKSKKMLQLTEKEQALKGALIPKSKLIIGKSKPIMDMLSMVKRVAQSDASVLVTGENGTGKELVAKMIHQHSLRNNQVVIAVDMGAIPESLFESELFGHVKGAFTDAKESRPGKIEAAEGGTLFLDEIGNLPLNLQAKLLTAIQEQTIYKVGSNSPVKVDFRLVCATNKNLFHMVEQGSFREDLLYRINTIHIEVPPLRERENDALLIANFFMQKFANRYQKKVTHLSQEAENRLLSHHWPGNVRELEHAIEKAVILTETDFLDESYFWFSNKTKPFKATKESTIAAMEQQLIEQALDKHNNNYSNAAKQLGITRQTLYNKVKKYHIEQ